MADISGAGAAAAGHHVTILDRVGSTNDAALQMGETAPGEEAPHWIVARMQDAGRGRDGRAWASPAGNLYASLLLIDPSAERHLPELGFVAGIAARAAVARVWPDGDARVRLKWPNDLLCDGAKLAGILLESRRSGRGRLLVAVGIGINVASAPEGLPYAATALAACGWDGDADRVFAALREEMTGALALWGGGAGFAAVLARWRAGAHGLGAAISVRRHGTRLEGVFGGVDEAGRLLLRTPETMHVIEAADVHFPQGEEAGRG